MSEPRSSLASRWHEALVRRRYYLFAGFLLHLILAHWFFIGITTWDGLGHRVPPVVELLQHGSFGLDKYANWALIGLRPFVELTNAPFMAVFGMNGLYLAFALSLFPFCVVALYLFTREATGDKRAAFYSAVVYALVPMVNTQLFSGYIDWAITGLLAFFLYSLLALRRTKTPSAGAYVNIVVSTFLFTMSRQQAPYLAIFFMGVVAGLLCVRRANGPRRGVRIEGLGVLGLALLAFGLGIALPAWFQITNYLRYGTPLYPFAFNALGIKLGDGFSIQTAPTIFGLPEYTPAALWRASLGAWILPSTWPAQFFDSRNYGTGVFFVLALLTLPFSLKRANWPTRILLASFVVISVAGKDFWCPRFAYTLILGMCAVSGLALSSFLDGRRQPLYFAFLSIAALHAFRPKWDMFRISQGDTYPRMNVSNSPLFLKGTFDVPIYEDRHAKFVIAYAPGNSFILPLFGRKLTNEVVTSVPKDKIGEHCEGLRELSDRGPDYLVVDDEDLTKNCPRTCAMPGPRCFAYRLEQPATSSSKQ